MQAPSALIRDSCALVACGSRTGEIGGLYINKSTVSPPPPPLVEALLVLGAAEFDVHVTSDTPGE